MIMLTLKFVVAQKSFFLEFWDLIPAYLSRDAGTGGMTGALLPLLFEMEGIGALT